MNLRPGMLLEAKDPELIITFGTYLKVLTLIDPTEYSSKVVQGQFATVMVLFPERLTQNEQKLFVIDRSSTVWTVLVGGEIVRANSGWIRFYLKEVTS